MCEFRRLKSLSGHVGRFRLNNPKHLEILPESLELNDSELF